MPRREETKKGWAAKGCLDSGKKLICDKEERERRCGSREFAFQKEVIGCKKRRRFDRWQLK
jgi:hypothetical protein